MHFSVESYIMGPDMTESACFRTVSGAVKVFTFTDRHLVIEDFIHHDKACISASILEAAPFKMQHVTNTRCISLTVGDISQPSVEPFLFC